MGITTEFRVDQRRVDQRPVRAISTAGRVAERVYNTAWVHRTYPLAAELALARSRAARDWNSNEHLRARAMLQMQYLLGNSSRAAEAERLGEAYLYEVYRRSAVRWRAWLIKSTPIENLDVLRDLHAQGRGVIITWNHHANFASQYAAVASRGFRLHAPSLLEAMGPNASPPQRQHIRTCATNGTSVFMAAGSYPLMKSLLERGEILNMACDVPGSTSVTFLGRTVGWTTGVARLSKETGAPILPITAHRRGSLQTLRFEAPIHPEDHCDWTEILPEVARRFEPSILAWPEAIEVPMIRSRPLGEDAEVFRALPGDR